MQGLTITDEGAELVVRVRKDRDYGVSQNGRCRVGARTGGYVDVGDGMALMVFLAKGREGRARQSKYVGISEAEIAGMLSAPRRLGQVVDELAHRRCVGRNAARRLVGLALGDLLCDLERGEVRTGEHVSARWVHRSVMLSAVSTGPAEA